MSSSDEMFEWMMETNLSLTAQFHNHVKSILSEKSGEIDQVESLDEAQKEYWKRNYDTHFPKKLRETAFLLMFGHLEEMLFLLSKSYNPHGADLGNGIGIIKFKPYIKSLLNDELAASRDYQIIREAQLVRNSLIHIAGRISLSRSRKELESLLKKSPDSADRVQITAEGLKQFQLAVRGLTTTLLKKVLKKVIGSGL